MLPKLEPSPLSSLRISGSPPKGVKGEKASKGEKDWFTGILLNSFNLPDGRNLLKENKINLTPEANAKKDELLPTGYTFRVTNTPAMSSVELYQNCNGDALVAIRATIPTSDKTGVGGVRLFKVQDSNNSNLKIKDVVPTRWNKIIADLKRYGYTIDSHEPSNSRRVIDQRKSCGTNKAETLEFE